MSHLPSRKSNAHRATFVGLPTGSGIAIIAAALFTGALVSVYCEQIGWPYLTLYAASVILVTALVKPRGLFLTVASSPILFFAGLIATGWVIARSNTPGDGGGLSKTSLLAIAYPVVEFFPVLAAVTLGSAAIAVLRIRLIKRQNARLERRDVRDRTRVAETNRRTSRQSRRARERTNAVTVEELLQRRQARESGGTTRVQHPPRRTEESTGSRVRNPAPRPTQKRPRRSLDDDLYGN